MSYAIGGADGPTSVFVAWKMEPDWINIFGLIIVVLLLLPNILYAIRFRGQENKCTNKGLMILEQIGRYASMFFMIFNVGQAEFGFHSLNAFLIYGAGNIVLLIAYWLIWMLYFGKRGFRTSMALAVIPVCIFLLNGIALMHIPLIISGAVFGIAHIYITYQNAKEMIV